MHARSNQEQATGFSGYRTADCRMEHEVSNVAFRRRPSISSLNAVNKLVPAKGLPVKCFLRYLYI